MEVKAGYKQTEVGIIPEDWRVMTLAKVCGMKSGESITGTSIDQFSEYPCYGGNGLRGFTSQFTHDGDYALIGRQGALCGNVLGVRGKFFASEHAVVVTPFEQTDIKWLTYVLEDMNLNQYSESSAQPGLSVAKILNLTLAVPPTKSEQEATAEALSDADALIEALEGLIAKKRQVKEGAMQELLSGKRRLPGFSRKWEEKTIGSFADVKTGPFGSALHERDYVSQGTPLITVEHLSENGLVHFNMSMVSDFDVQRLKAYTVQVNDIVFSRVGAVDRNSLIRKDEEGWLFSGSLLRLRVIKDDIHAPFISYFFYSEPFRNYVLSMAVGQTRLSLNTKIISNTPITIPSFEEQTAIAEILSDMDAEITALEGKLSKARQVKQGMMSVLLTGRVRLI